MSPGLLGRFHTGPRRSARTAEPKPMRTRRHFCATLPRLIIEHNIYGVDIDPRAAQIAPRWRCGCGRSARGNDATSKPKIAH